MSDADDHDDFSPRSGQTRSKSKRKSIIFDKLESMIDAEEEEAVMEQEEQGPPPVVRRRSLRIQLIGEEKERQSFSSMEETPKEKPKKRAKANAQPKRSLKSDPEVQRLAEDHDDFSPRSSQTRSKLKRKNLILNKLESFIDAEEVEAEPVVADQEEPVADQEELEPAVVEKELPEPAVMEDEDPGPSPVVRRRSLHVQPVKEQQSVISVKKTAKEKPKQRAKGQRKRPFMSDPEDHDDFSPRPAQTKRKYKRKSLVPNEPESFFHVEQEAPESAVVEQEEPELPLVRGSLHSELGNKEKEAETEEMPKRKYTRKAKDVKERQSFENVEETPEDKPKRKYTRKSKELKEQQSVVVEEKPKRRSARKVKEATDQQSFANVSKTPKEKPKRRYTRKIKEEPIDFEDYNDISFQLPLPLSQQQEQVPDDNQMQLVPYQGGRRAQQLNIMSLIDPEFLRFEIESQARYIDELQQSIETIDNQASVLKDENLSLRRSSVRNEEIAVNEKQRAEEAWKKLDMMRIYNRACEQGAEQRYFHEMKISDTADEVKEETGKKVKIVMDKRCELAEEKAVLTTKVKVLMKKMRKAKKRFDEDNDWRKFNDLVKAIAEVLRQSGVDGELLISTLEEESSDLFTECIGNGGGGVSVEMDNYFKMIIQGLGTAVGGDGMQITLGVYGEINMTDESTDVEGESDDSDEDE